MNERWTRTNTSLHDKPAFYCTCFLSSSGPGPWRINMHVTPWTRATPCHTLSRLNWYKCNRKFTPTHCFNKVFISQDTEYLITVYGFSLTDWWKLGFTFQLGYSNQLTVRLLAQSSNRYDTYSPLFDTEKCQSSETLCPSWLHVHSSRQWRLNQDRINAHRSKLFVFLRRKTVCTKNKSFIITGSTYLFLSVFFSFVFSEYTHLWQHVVKDETLSLVVKNWPYGFEPHSFSTCIPWGKFI